MKNQCKISAGGSSGHLGNLRRREGRQSRPSREGCRKSGKATFSSRMQSAARRICPLQADKSHTCGLRSVFSDAHPPGGPLLPLRGNSPCVAGENRFPFFRACGRELCETFLACAASVIRHAGWCPAPDPRRRAGQPPGSSAPPGGSTSPGSGSGPPAPHG